MRRCGGAVVLFASLLLACEDSGTFGPSGPSGPDLRIDSVDVPELRQGQTTTVTVVVRSSGTEPVPAPFTVRLVVARDSGYSDNFCGPFEWRRQLAEGDLGAGEELSFEAAVPLAPTDPVGTALYFLATADSDGEVDEALENNNEIALTRSVAPPPSPDLRVLSCAAQTQLRAGQVGTIVTTIVNDGEVAAGAPFPVSLRLYEDSARISLFDSDTWTQAVDLGPGLTASFTASVSIPLSFGAGYLYYTATVDVPDNAVTEGYEDNNTLEGAIRVLPPPMPDLALDVKLPTAIHVGEDMTLTMTVWNRGDQASPSTTLRYSFYAVIDGVETPTNTYTQGIGALDPSRSEVHTKPNVGTSGLGRGDTVIVRAMVDPYNSIRESNEDNNSDEAQCVIQ